MKRITLLLLLAALLLVANGLVVTRRASAMGSAGYKLDWFTLMTGTGGRMSSAKIRGADHGRSVGDRRRGLCGI